MNKEVRNMAPTGAVSSNGTNVPEKKFRAGPLCATVWLNKSQNGAGEPVQYRTISFERGYKEKDSTEWKNTTSMRTNDIPKVNMLLEKAYEYIIMQGVEA